MSRSLIVHPSWRLAGTVTVPGDKSISHRAVILGSVADGRTRIVNLLEAEDVLATVAIMRSLGVKIRKIGHGKWRIEGVGLDGLKRPSKILNCGNSGTTLRLLTGLLAGYRFASTLTGDRSLNSRPMGRVIEPLRRMGAVIHERRNRKGRFITVSGGRLRGGIFRLPAASAQLKSALLLAALNAGQAVTVVEPAKSRDHSERMLRAFGADLAVKGLRVTLRPGKKLKRTKIQVPADFSSAAFFLVAGLVSRDPQSRIVLKNVGVNPTRTGALDVLLKMGGKIRLTNRREIGGELLADLHVRPSPLHGVVLSGEIIPRLIDEIPILAVAASLASGRTVIRGAGELRLKETDRIRALAAELPRFGIRTKELPDGLEILGTGEGRRPGGAKTKSYGDHRIAMSLAILGTAADGMTTIEDTGCIATSFPGFISLLKKAGVKVST